MASLLEPNDEDQRVQDYDWYIRYPTTDLLSQDLGEEKDLKMYVRAARLAEGEEVDPILAKGLEMGSGLAVVAGGGEEVWKDRTTFYDAWLKG